MIRSAFFAAASLCASSSIAFAAPGDGTMTADDRADLEAMVIARDDKAAARILARLDALTDQFGALAAEFAPAARDAAKGKDGRKDGGRKPSPKEAREAKEAKRAAASAAELELMPKLASAATAWRLSQIMQPLDGPRAAALWNALGHDSVFAQTLAFTVMPESDKLTHVADVATLLGEGDASGVAAHPELAAAIAVVHDVTPVSIRINENTGRAPSPETVWRWYTGNAAAMRFGIDIAPELLVLVVDVPAAESEIAWAFKQFRGIPRVGALYQEVEYDHDHLKGRPKKVNQAGWNLPNILRCGGICADQAYFTTTVAKALGIPAVYTIGTDSSSAHAWAGFVQAGGTPGAKRSNAGPSWDVEGRYDSYRGVTGRFAHPQSGRQQPDAVLPMLVQWGLEPRVDRVRASTLRVADERLEERVREKGSDAAALSETREALLSAALRICPTDVRSWLQVRDLGKRDGLEPAEMEAWFAWITDLCGANYPEMVIEVCSPLIASVKDVQVQHTMWINMAEYLSKRADLAGQALMSDGRMWETAKEPEKAGKAYELILKHYPDGGPPVEKALERAGNLLRKGRDGRRLLALYDGTFNRMTPPKDLPGVFGTQSTWYRVGKAYVKLLREAGRGGDANALEARLERHLKAEGS
jgi:hypothetical protein